MKISQQDRDEPANLIQDAFEADSGDFLKNVAWSEEYGWMRVSYSPGDQAGQKWGIAFGANGNPDDGSVMIDVGAPSDCRYVWDDDELGYQVADAWLNENIGRWVEEAAHKLSGIPA